MSAELSPQSYLAFSQFLQKQLGIVLGDNRQYLVRSRLTAIARDCQYADINTFIQDVVSLKNKAISDRCLELMTTNETFWFRDGYPFSLLSNAILPSLFQQQKRLRIWSSACASGAVTANTAVFYTVWSYARGAGRQIVNSVAEHIRSTQPEITRWVTLSPLTDMAEQFHLRNGARLHSKHTTCQIFEYTRLMQSAESKQARSA